jgi:carbon-monoxide dehydrogenase iron sulfur subunit
MENAVSEIPGSFPRIFIGEHGGKKFAIQCRQCDNAPCVNACISGARILDRENERIIFLEERCVGCWMCVMVCPYSNVLPVINKGKPVLCDFCAKKEDGPQCIKACPTGALFYCSQEDFEQKIKSYVIKGLENDRK